MKTLKKMLVLVVLVLMLGCINLSLTACSKDEYINGFYCKVKSDSTIAVYVDKYDMEELVIPDTINGLKVTGVMKPKAKKDISTTLIKVVLPETVRWIEKEAFKNCVALEEINFPEKLAIIYKSAFENCSSLKTIRIPKSVKEIESYAFKNCMYLQNAYVPGSIEYIGIDAFCASPDLEIWTERNERGDWSKYWAEDIKEIHWGNSGNNPEAE